MWCAPGAYSVVLVELSRVLVRFNFKLHSIAPIFCVQNQIDALHLTLAYPLTPNAPDAPLPAPSSGASRRYLDPRPQRRNYFITFRSYPNPHVDLPSSEHRMYGKCLLKHRRFISILPPTRPTSLKRLRSQRFRSTAEAGTGTAGGGGTCGDLGI